MRVAHNTCMTQIKSFRDLIVWQTSTDLADVCFDIVDAIPHSFKFAIADQLIRAGISIPSNIAEGSRRPNKACLNHLSYLLGSHGEVETLLEIIRRRRFVPDALLARGCALVDPIGKMLHGLTESLERQGEQ